MSNHTDSSDHKPHEFVSESRRQRHIYRYYPPTLRGFDLSATAESSLSAPFPPPGFVPVCSKDPALTAFAQLAALHLSASTALISLVDLNNQYILAESTPTLPLRGKSSRVASSHLWLGNACIPRSHGICGAVVSRNVAEGHLVIDNLANDDRFAEMPFVKGEPHFRFYIGVPLVNTDGVLVGSLCVFDKRVRVDIGKNEVAILNDIAATVIEHLETYRLRGDNQRGEHMIRGLMNFIDGASAMRGRFDEFKSSQSLPPHHGTVPLDNGTGSPHKNNGVTPEKTHERPEIRRSSTSRSSLPGNRILKPLQESILPDGARTMFSRAANVMRESGDLDGVVIYDASVAVVGEEAQLRMLRRESQSLISKGHGESEDSYVSTSERERSSSSEPPSNANLSESERACSILGFSSQSRSSVDGDLARSSHQSFPEPRLQQFLEKFPGGRIFNFGPSGDFTTSEESDSIGVRSTSMSDDSLGSKSPGVAAPGQKSRRTKRRTRLQDLIEALQAVAPAARSIACLPLWDFERSRWFALCVCWTTKVERTLNPDVDLVYLKAFGNSIMTELAQIDLIASNRTKTAFVSSISHELRSPLHGILGGVEFLQGTKLDAFQTTMLHSIFTCGRTLLDTLSHVLEFSKIDQNRKKRPLAKVKSTVRVRDSEHISLSTPQPKRGLTKSDSATDAVLDISTVTEEVVEAVFASQSYRIAYGTSIPDGSSTVYTNSASNGLRTSTIGSLSEGGAKRKLVHVVLDIPYRENWNFRIPPGTWGRILMNVFGNALKYTESGYVKIAVSANKSSRRLQAGETEVILTVSDSGVGMSPEYLANRLYTPFSQENSFSTGVGLGLSIVRQLLETIGGRIDVKSQPNNGTTVAVKLTLPDAGTQNLLEDSEFTDSFAKARLRMTGRKICILHRSDVDLSNSDVAHHKNSTHKFVKALEETMSGWLGMDVSTTSKWDSHHMADIVILPEPSFEYLAAVRARRHGKEKVPITIFLAIDAIEAAALSVDARVLDKESVVEICTQPCGPNKLAKILNHCLNRFQDPSENISKSLNTPPMIEPPELDAAVTSTNGHTFPSQPCSQHYSGLPRQPHPPRSLSPAKPVQSELRVLIVDDNNINRRLLTAFMKKHKLAYAEGTNGLEGLNIYQEASQKPNSRFYVVLMDLSMPVMDGMAATKRIRRHEHKYNIVPPAFIIALTGLTGAAARFEAEEAGVDLYMTKPVNFTRLADLLKRQASECL